MKKIVLISAIVATGLFADMMTDMATDAVTSQVKTEVRATAVKHIAGEDEVKKDLVNKGADVVLGKEDPVEKLKTDAVGSVLGSKTVTPDVTSTVTDAAKKEALKVF